MDVVPPPPIIFEGQNLPRTTLNYVSKIYGLNFEIVAVTRPCIRLTVIQIAFSKL